MEIFRTHTYAKALKRLGKLGASKADIDAMETSIAYAPEAGEVIPGAGGLRKIRFGYSGVGKRGGGRTIYYAMVADGVIYLLTAYAKVDQADLTIHDLQLFKALIKELNRDR